MVGDSNTAVSDKVEEWVKTGETGRNKDNIIYKEFRCVFVKAMTRPKIASEMTDNGATEMRVWRRPVAYLGVRARLDVVEHAFADGHQTADLGILQFWRVCDGVELFTTILAHVRVG